MLHPMPFRTAILLAVASLSLAVGASDKSESEAVESLATFPQKLRDDVQTRFPGFRVVRAKRESSLYVLWIFAPDLLNSHYELTLRDGRDKKFNVRYGAGGDLEKAGEHRLPFAHLPEKVRQTLNEWSADARWDDWVEVKKPIETKAVYKVRCRIGKKEYRAELFEDGTVKKNDGIPAAVVGESQQVGLLRFEQDRKFGYKDGTGKVVIPPTYDDAHDFACGLAPVNQGAVAEFVSGGVRREGGAWGYINARGQVVVPFTFDRANEFSEGLAQVRDKNGVRFIDTEGKTVVTLGEVSQAGDFKEGVAPIYISPSPPKQDWQTKFLGKKGETVFIMDGYAQEFHEGMAVLVVRDGAGAESGRYGFLDHAGKVAIAPQFAEALPFSEGLAAVRTKKTTVYGMGDTWGYIDKTGAYVLKPEFNETHPFLNGVARVHVGGTLDSYEMHSPPRWKGGEWRLIEKNGQILKRSEKWVTYDVPDRTP